MAVKRRRPRNDRPPLDRAALEQVGLSYVARYATSRAKLASYLRRKVLDRGWSGPGEAPIAAVIERMVSLGYIDDRAFAYARAEALRRRGFGERRVREALRGAGIAEEDAADAQESARRGAWEAALRLAERRKIGPFASEEPDRVAREKAFAILLRAGHPSELARRLAHAGPGEFPDADSG